MTTAPTVTVEQVLRDVLALAQAQPDRIAACSYVPARGRGACIVGEALAARGFTHRQLSGVNGARARTAMRILGVDGTNYDRTKAQFAASELVTLIQEEQDRGATWSEAVVQAVEKADPDDLTHIRLAWYDMLDGLLAEPEAGQ